MKIIIVGRENDYHASLEGHPEIWGCGKSPNAAIGDLIRSHVDAFKIEVEDK